MSRLPEIRITLVGREGVGKTWLASRLTHGNPKETMESTMGAAFQRLILHRWNNGSLELHQTMRPITSLLESSTPVASVTIWDTAGQERYAQLLPMYYRNSAIVIGVYDGMKDSADGLGKVLNQIRQSSPQSRLLIWRNKCDLPGGQMKQCIDGIDDVDQILVSAKTGTNVKESFMIEINQYLTSPQFTNLQTPSNTIVLGRSPATTDHGLWDYLSSCSIL